MSLLYRIKRTRIRTLSETSLSAAEQKGSQKLNKVGFDFVFVPRTDDTNDRISSFWIAAHIRAKLLY